jgi:hypothetical protein
MNMSTLTMTPSDLGLLSPHVVISLESARIPLRVLARSFAALIVLTALIAPDCCLTGSHVHGADLDGFVPVCLGRAVWR